MTRRPSRPAERATDREVGVVEAVLVAGSEKAAAHRLVTAAFQFRQPDVIESALTAAVRCADTDGQRADAAGHLAVALREAVATGYA